MSISSTVRVYILLMVAAASLSAQQPVSPIQNPHPVFNNAVGLACAGCSLYSYAAGSTTPQATFTDSTGATQNTNPLILGADGGPLTPSGTSGAIWMGQLAYKFVLIDLLNNTVFTVDDINANGAGGLFPCGPSGAIQIANSAVTGFSCDPTITINTSAHSINVGTLPTAHVSIGSLGTPTSWVFDTTTPATALASLGGALTNAGTLNQLAYYASAGTALSGTSSIPSAITATTQSPGDNSTKIATTAYVALPGAINPTGVQIATGVSMTGNQGTGAAVQHSTGSTSSGHGVNFDANGNTIDSGCAAGVGTPSQLSGSRVLGTVYQNTTLCGLKVSGYATITSGSGDSTVTCKVGVSSTPGITDFATTITGTTTGEPVGFWCLVPPSYYYEVTFTNIISTTPGSWVETPIE